jgi:hypothetical protein
MNRPRIARELLSERQLPGCPHCLASKMEDATVTLGQLLDAWPIDGYVATQPDGYAHPNNIHTLVVECPSCGKTSAVAIDGVEVKLIAAVTEKDERLAYSQVQSEVR